MTLREKMARAGHKRFRRFASDPEEHADWDGLPVHVKENYLGRAARDLETVVQWLETEGLRLAGSAALILADEIAGRPTRSCRAEFSWSSDEDSGTVYCGLMPHPSYDHRYVPLEQLKRLEADRAAARDRTRKSE